jgi:hypothetical protein
MVAAYAALDERRLGVASGLEGSVRFCWQRFRQAPSDRVPLHECPTAFHNRTKRGIWSGIDMSINGPRSEGDVHKVKEFGFAAAFLLLSVTCAAADGT